MDNKLIVKELNINGRSGYSSAYAIPPFIASELIGNENDGNVADIIILTEFIITAGWHQLKTTLEGKGYALFTSYVSNQNGILIAINKNIKGLDFESAIMSTTMNTERKEKPNFLQVTVEYNNKPLAIIGARVRIRTIKQKAFPSYELYLKAVKDEYLERKTQAEALIDHVSKQSRILGAADFNNLKIRGNEEKKYLDIKEEYHYDKAGNELASYDTYNYHILKDLFEESGFCISTPKGKDCYSWVLGKTKFKEDHIITSNSITVRATNYIWDFVNEKNGYGKLTAEDDKSSIIGCPDHAIITAEVEIK